MSDDLIHDAATIRAAWDDDDPEVTRIARRVGAALNSGRDKAVVDVVLDEVATLRAEVERLTTQNDRLAILLGRRMTGKEIGAALSRMIETGELEIPPPGSPMLTSKQVRAELGLDAS